MLLESSSESTSPFPSHAENDHGAIAGDETESPYIVYNSFTCACY